MRIVSFYVEYVGRVSFCGDFPLSVFFWGSRVVVLAFFFLRGFCVCFFVFSSLVNFCRDDISA